MKFVSRRRESIKKEVFLKSGYCPEKDSDVIKWKQYKKQWDQLMSALR